MEKKLTILSTERKEKRVKVYHPKYGIVDQRYYHIHISNDETGQDSIEDFLKDLPLENLKLLLKTNVEEENFETAILIQKEIDKRK